MTSLSTPEFQGNSAAPAVARVLFVIVFAVVCAVVHVSTTWAAPDSARTGHSSLVCACAAAYDRPVPCGHKG